MRTRYGTSPWVDLFPGSRRPDRDRLRGDRTADVVVVGGGLTGCATAYACASAGFDVVLLERDRLGQGASGRSAGVLLPEPGPAFRDITGQYGLRTARRIFETWRRGALDGAALLRRLKIGCHLAPASVVQAVVSNEKQVRREYDARREAGLDLTWLNRRQLQQAMQLDAPSGMRTRDAFTLDPYRAAVGLAAAARRKGATLFERSRVTRVKFTRKHVDVIADGGAIRAGHVVIATGMPTEVSTSLRRHFKPRESYLVMTEPVAASVRRQLGPRDAILRDTAAPPHLVHWAPGDRLVVGGAAQNPTPAKKRPDVLVQRTGQLMYELLTMYPAISGLRPEYGWETQHGVTADGLMYIGAHRNYPRHLFALGGSRDSLTGAFVAARMLLRALQAAPDKADEAFAWTR